MPRRIHGTIVPHRGMERSGGGVGGAGPLSLRSSTMGVELKGDRMNRSQEPGQNPRAAVRMVLKQKIIGRPSPSN